MDLTDKRFQIDEGICYGLSLMYMCQFAQGGYAQGDKFLESIKELNQLSNLTITHNMDDYDKIIIESKNYMLMPKSMIYLMKPFICIILLINILYFIQQNWLI